MEDTQWLREQARNLRYKGFFISAQASNGVQFADARESLNEAREVAKGLALDKKPSYTEIEIWNNDCSEQIV
ncbi:hypothetical protein LCGC14_1894140 [marine sediment metagenome]|uniref:DUF5678 domain-containing protein n=1 Tax=marine sediment metagenome TaxID=412755 RepID=A0A0F9ICE9_9ZZZZ